MRVFNMTDWDVRITVEAESIKSGLLEGLMKLFKDTGYTVGQREERENGNLLVWCLNQKKEEDLKG